MVEEVQLSADKAKEINALLNKVEKLNSISDLDDEKKKSLQIQIRTLGDQLIQHKGAKIQRIA